ncbi:class I SAM-dependent methyltransferase [Nocardia donostiensis]|uniref:SAM-dependent methyltransferase n=1 Tax=Nocardia donostiensis TaxID=1538463 RepID=A0A1V2TGG0_9NOCA|nr:class I SAM-dependent methyltransferase [Nocardia donostiensis]ONM48553.1 SAM-dependent methyltransferase [Nocardia donostiensis]OQS16744.1 SAM-dependent methyltransferase [Nocardia donostiensis]OQS23207.1 SAM-dependent methyltransferase [Nocardia donostiensis]
MTTQPAEVWNSFYDNDTAPWVIGEPQPAILALERDGWIRGRVLDPGTGAGEHTIALTRLGYDVLGIDLSPSAVDRARRNAEARAVPARFEVADVLTLTEPGGDRPGVFDTIVDSALFHVFGEEPEARAAYVRGLHAICEPGGYVHILALSDTEPGFGPRISDSLIRDSFGDGWEIEDLRPSSYRGRITETVVEQAVAMGLPKEGVVDTAAWLARIRRR